MVFETIETPRLILRKLDAAAYAFAFNNYSEDELTHFFGCQTDQEIKLERRRHEGGLETFNKKLLAFHLLEKDSGNVIGWCGFHTWYIDHYRAELGYGLSSDSFKQKGLMTEAIIPIINYGWEVMKLERIEAMVATYNLASLALLKKMNFTKEGLLRNHYMDGDQLSDSLVYSLLKEEWTYKIIS